MKKLITSALPYVNNVPHLGNIIGCVLSADVYARFCRSKGYETLYVCGTDEYGTATENKAREEGLTPREICDKYNAIHTEVYKTFNISFDVFGRTSTEEQTKVAHEIFHDLDKAGYIAEEVSERTYCEHDEMFLADRYVEGTCPKCGYEDARGDQCDSCGALLEPETLIKPKCKICGKAPVMKETRHLHLELDKLQGKLEEWYNTQSKEGDWTHNALTTTKGWFDRGLNSRPITRDLKWGIPVPKPGYEDKVFYVWFDAPIGYISITAAGREDWREWWMENKDVKLYQFMAKDNIPFHTVLFPATLMGTGKDWTLLHHINSTEYLNYEESKFSKSRGIGVFGTDVSKTGIPVDLWRFYLLSVRPEKNDSAFVWEEFYNKVNYEFIDNIGNLFNRVLVYLTKNFEGEIKDVELDDTQKTLVSECQELFKQIDEAMESVKLREAMRLILMLSKKGNKFFQDSEVWVKIKEDPENVHGTISLLTYLIRNLGILLSPFMPSTSEKLFDILQLDPAFEKEELWTKASEFTGLSGHKIGTPEIIYKKLDVKEADGWRKKFSGEFEDFSLLDVRVGQIEAVDTHPAADHLYVMKVNIGEEQPRTICAGLTSKFKPEELTDRKVLVLSNLQKADLRGVDSEGMVLTAEKRKKLELFEVADFEIGTRVSHGEATKDSIISIDDFKKVELAVKDNKLTCDGKVLTLDGKEINTLNIGNGKVR